MANRIVGYIYETDDYSAFRKLAGNRDTKGVAKIIKSINEVGYIRSPILINEKMEIVDGQNRFEALKELNLPVQYIVEEGIGLQECRALNIGQTNWGTWDYIDSYAEQGNEHYQRLKALIEEFRSVYKLEAILSFATPSALGKASFNRSAGIRTGDIVLSEKKYEKARSELIEAKELGFEGFRARFELPTRSYYGAVAYAFLHPLINTRRLIEKMEKDPKAIPSCLKITDMLGYFDNAYNKGRTATGKVFMAADFQQGKYLK